MALEAIRPRTVAAYIEQLGAGMAKPSVKQHLAAIRQLFDYLVTGDVLPSNPAGAVRGPIIGYNHLGMCFQKRLRQGLDVNPA